MKIAGMMRVKNEARWIARAVESLGRVCGAGIHMLDDGSTDDTTTLASSMGAHVIPTPFDTFDETRDKNFLVREVMTACDPDWIVHIDGDEALEEIAARDLATFLVASPSGVEAHYLSVLYLWNSEQQIRVDGVYGRFCRASVFRTRATDLLFRSSTIGGLHCGNVPADTVPRSSAAPFRIKHYGYLDRETRLKKYAFYNRIDPNNVSEDGYRHVVQGDVPEIPATAQLLHAGPLHLAAYEEALSG